MKVLFGRKVLDLFKRHTLHFCLYLYIGTTGSDDRRFSLKQPFVSHAFFFYVGFSIYIYICLMRLKVIILFYVFGGAILLFYNTTILEKQGYENYFVNGLFLY